MSHRKFKIFCILHNKTETVIRRRIDEHIPAKILAPWTKRAKIGGKHSTKLYSCKQTYQQLKAAVDAQDHLVYLPSTNPECGYGVFALEKFQVDQYITDYGGKLIDASLVNRLNLNESHLKALPNKNLWDGTQGSTTDAARLAQFMNSSTTPNVKQIKPVCFNSFH